jgi:alkylation response protein AidB-like acyl-CoA dehydrogenase
VTNRWVVDLELNPEQELLRDTTRQFLRDSAPLSTVRQWAGLPGGYPADWWRRGAELGWTTLLVDQRRGGGSVSGEGLCDLAIVAEEMGALVSPGPLAPVNVVAQTISQEGTDEQAATLLPGLLSGETVASWCGAEPGRPFNTTGIAVTARAEGAGFRVDGVKRPVEAGVEAEWFLVTVIGVGGLMQLVVPAATKGVTVSSLQGIDLVRRNAEVRFDGAYVPASAVVGSPGNAARAFERQFETVLVLQCAEIVGAAEQVFGFTVAYAFDRYSFGRPLASYQALKHRFADMKLWLESAQAITVEATRAVQLGVPDAAEVARVAKAYVAEHCPELIQECVQLHGGIGVTWDHNLHLYLRRVVLHRQTYGGPYEHHEQLATLAGSRKSTRRHCEYSGEERSVVSAEKEDVTPGNRHDLAEFRARATAWVAANLRPLGGLDPFKGHALDEMDQVERAKAIQRQLYEAGFAGLSYPKEYGGQSLPPAYQEAFNEVSRGHELPLLLNTPTFTIILPTILEFGTEEQKQRLIPAALSGESLWVQFLSEPTGGSDLAGALTRATRDGDVLILNGSKIWSTYAWKSDYGLCLVRTDWDVPKHRGLSVLIVRVHQPGITIQRIKEVNGEEEFCQEFFDDVLIPVTDVLGEIGDGWTVVSRLLFHEREAVSGSSPYEVGPRMTETRGGSDRSLVLSNGQWSRRPAKAPASGGGSRSFPGAPGARGSDRGVDCLGATPSPGGVDPSPFERDDPSSDGVDCFGDCRRQRGGLG